MVNVLFETAKGYAAHVDVNGKRYCVLGIRENFNIFKNKMEEVRTIQVWKAGAKKRYTFTNVDDIQAKAKLITSLLNEGYHLRQLRKCVKNQ